MFVSSKKACQILGVHANTLRSWANAGKIEHYKTHSGQRRYDVSKYVGESNCSTVCYCRVSSAKQKDDLERQKSFMREQFPECEIIQDIGSGLNFKRKGLKSILERAMSGDKLQVVVAHRDRLCRFGFDLIEWIITRSGGKVLVLKQSDLSPQQELVSDILAIVQVFGSRLNGLRNYKNKMRKDLSDKGTEANS